VPKGIDQVYLAAAKVGGIHANATYPAEFIYANLLIEANLVHRVRTTPARASCSSWAPAAFTPRGLPRSP
jgi:nucleoside-diphosphate-sugar epimerase